LRSLDPSLLPWGLDKTIATKNPQVLEKDHFMQTNCYAAFWAKSYSQNTKGTKTAVDHWMWCREHDRFEEQRTVLPQLLMQLACGFFADVESWANVIVHQKFR
jgi:hypothetical protein